MLMRKEEKRGRKGMGRCSAGGMGPEVKEEYLQDSEKQSVTCSGTEGRRFGQPAFHTVKVPHTVLIVSL